MGSRRRRTRKQRLPPPDPLWRLGWSLWILAPQAIALAAIYSTGYDLQTRLLEWTYALFDVDAVFFVVLRVIIPSGLAFGQPPFLPMFTVIGAWCVLVGAAIHPRRFGRWRGVLMLLVGLATPGIWLSLLSVASAWFPHEPRMPADPWISAITTLCTQAFVAVLGGAAAAILFRAYSVAFAIIAAGILGAWITMEYNWNIAGGALLLTRTGASVCFAWAGWLFNPAILAASMWWGISARRAWKPSWACQACGYDLRSAPTTICPECGADAVLSHHSAFRLTQTTPSAPRPPVS